MPSHRHHFIPHWLIQILLLICLGSYFLLGLMGLVKDPALLNVIEKVSLFLFVFIYLLWFLLRSAAALKWKLGLVGGLALSVIFFFTQYQITGWSGLLNPEFEAVGSRDEDLDDPLDQLMGDDGNIDGPSFTHYFADANRSGKIQGKDMHQDWKKHPLKEVWRKNIGEGLSGFSVQGDYAIISEQRGEEELIVCYDTKTGKPRWAHREKVRHESVLGGVGPRATMSIDQAKVYAIGATGKFSCLALQTGELLWQHELQALVKTTEEDEKKLVPWGRSGSPLVFENKVIVPGGGSSEKYVSLLAFDATTGSKLWEGGAQQISYASPQLLELNGVIQIVSVNESSVTGHDIETGKVLWETELLGRTSANANCSQVCKISESELLLTKGYNTGSRVIRLSLKDGRWGVELKWKSRRFLKTKFSSPIRVSESMVVGLNEQDLQAIDVKSQEELWEGERYGYGQLLAYNDSLLVLSETGELALVDLKTGKELSRQTVLNGKTWCSLAVAGPYVLVRNNNEAVCFELPLKNETL